MNCDVRQLIDARGHEDFPEDMRRPPSLPSGLDQVDNINSIPSPLKPSSSIPLRLSQLAMAHSQPSVPRKPAPAAGAYRHRVPAPSGTRPLYKPPSNLVKKQTVKPPALEDRAGLAGRELSTGAVGSIPLGQDMATVQSVSLQQGRSFAPRSNARGDASSYSFIRAAILYLFSANRQWSEAICLVARKQFLTFIWV